jgi:hypothetical protein
VKAFDKVKRDKLFEALKKIFPQCIVKKYNKNKTMIPQPGSTV